MKLPTFSLLATLSASAVLSAPLEKKQQEVTDLDVLQFALTVSISFQCLRCLTLTEMPFLARTSGKRLLQRGVVSLHRS